MKILLSLLIVSNCLLAETFKTDKNVFNHDYSKLNDLHKKVSDEMVKNVFKNFCMDTGDTQENLNKYLEESKTDENLLAGIKAFYIDRESKTLKYKDISIAEYKSVNMNVPKLKEAIIYLTRSTNSGNVLGAYLGEYIMSQKFMFMNSDGKSSDEETLSFIRNNYPKYLDLLMKNKYAYAYLFKTVYLDGVYEKSTIEEKEDIALNGFDLAKDNKKLPEYIKHNLKERLVRYDAIRKYRKNK